MEILIFMLFAENGYVHFFSRTVNTFVLSKSVTHVSGIACSVLGVRGAVFASVS